MIWLTWRQHRKQLLASVIGLAVLAAFIYPTGRAMRSDFARLGLAACMGATPGPGNGACESASRQFTDQWSPFTLIGLLFLVLPLLVGLFWGAPVVAREVEHGTHRLVWTQGVSRRQWALVKFAFVGGFAVLAAVVYGLGMSWWLTPLSQTGQMNRFDPLLFDMQGVVPIGYTLFAVALGVFGGTMWPRMLPAMGVTLAGFLGARVAIEVLARQHYMKPVDLTAQLASATPINDVGDWVLNDGIKNAGGQLVLPHARIECHAAPGAAGPPQGAPACGSDEGVGAGAYNWELVQPAGRYWIFQGIETGVFVVLAAVLLYLAFRRVRRIA
jgi:hypothetical protein